MAAAVTVYYQIKFPVAQQKPLQPSEALHAYETPSCLPTHFAVTLSLYTLIPTVYRALLKSAVSGIGHRIHTTKKTIRGDFLDTHAAWFSACQF